MSPVKNLMRKSRKQGNPYLIYEAGGWKWEVLKSWQTDNQKPFARWFCFVTSLMCPNGEYGDCYVKDVQGYATCTKIDDAIIDAVETSLGQVVGPFKWVEYGT